MEIYFSYLFINLIKITGRSQFIQRHVLNTYITINNLKTNNLGEKKINNNNKIKMN